MKRRDFMKLSTGTLLLASADRLFGAAAPSKTIRLAIVGCARSAYSKAKGRFALDPKGPRGRGFQVMREAVKVPGCEVAADGTLWVALYSDATAKFPGARLAISGGYPYADTPVVVSVTRAQAGKVRFRVPAWSKTFTVNGKPATAEKGWCEVDAPAGASAWSLGFDMGARVVPWTRAWGKRVPASPAARSITDVGNYTVHFMEWYSPEMTGLSRNYPGVEVMRGPLVLAKGRLAGTARAETFYSFATENGCEGWKAELKPLAIGTGTAGVPRAWSLTMKRGVEERTFAVSDYASLSNIDDPNNWFSLWF